MFHYLLGFERNCQNTVLYMEKISRFQVFVSKIFRNDYNCLGGFLSQHLSLGKSFQRNMEVV